MFLQVFSVKLKEDVLFESLNTILSTAFENYVVNLDNWKNALTREVVLIEKKVNCFTPKYFELLNNRAKMPKQCLRRLL